MGCQQEPTANCQCPMKMSVLAEAEPWERRASQFLPFSHPHWQDRRGYSWLRGLTFTASL